MIVRKIGEQYTEDGVKRIMADVFDNKYVIVRDPYASESACSNIKTEISLEKDNEDAGIAAIRANSKLIKESKGIRHLPVFGDTVFLLGSGGSLMSPEVAPYLPILSRFGTVIATNRAAYVYAGMEDRLDYCFFCDSRSYLFCDTEEWRRFDSSKVKGIFATNTWNGLVSQQWEDRFFFSYGIPVVERWRATEKECDIDHRNTGTLDSGFVSLYSLLFLIAKHPEVKRVVLVGHDFSFVDYMYHFNERFSVSKHVRPEASFMPTIVDDCNGNGVLTLKHIERAGRVCLFAMKFLDERGVKVFNGSRAGILAAPWIKQEKLSIILSK